eukprot:764943-Hanusia_phi.AAC.2
MSAAQPTLTQDDVFALLKQQLWSISFSQIQGSNSPDAPLTTPRQELPSSATAYPARAVRRARATFGYVDALVPTTSMVRASSVPSAVRADAGCRWARQLLCVPWKQLVRLLSSGSVQLHGSTSTRRKEPAASARAAPTRGSCGWLTATSVTTGRWGGMGRRASRAAGGTGLCWEGST